LSFLSPLGDNSEVGGCQGFSFREESLMKLCTCLGIRLSHLMSDKTPIPLPGMESALLVTFLPRHSSSAPIVMTEAGSVNESVDPTNLAIEALFRTINLVFRVIVYTRLP
jgi:hypothetical protein